MWLFCQWGNLGLWLTFPLILWLAENPEVRTGTPFGRVSTIGGGEFKMGGGIGGEGNLGLDTCSGFTSFSKVVNISSATGNGGGSGNFEVVDMLMLNNFFVLGSSFSFNGDSVRGLACDTKEKDTVELDFSASPSLSSSELISMSTLSTFTSCVARFGANANFLNNKTRHCCSKETYTGWVVSFLLSVK